MQTKHLLLCRSHSLARHLNCLYEHDADATVKCLQSKSREELQTAANTLLGEVRFMEFPFVMTDNDGHFFVHNVREQLRSGLHVNKVF
jgi:hypothetical protein